MATRQPLKISLAANSGAFTLVGMFINVRCPFLNKLLYLETIINKHFNLMRVNTAAACVVRTRWLFLVASLGVSSMNKLSYVCKFALFHLVGGRDRNGRAQGGATADQ